MQSIQNLIKRVATSRQDERHFVNIGNVSFKIDERLGYENDTFSYIGVYMLHTLSYKDTQVFTTYK